MNLNKILDFIKYVAAAGLMIAVAFIFISVGSDNRELHQFWDHVIPVIISCVAGVVCLGIVAGCDAIKERLK